MTNVTIPPSGEESEEKSALGYLLVCCTLIFIILAAHGVHKLHWSWLTESGAIIVLGIIIGGIFKGIDELRGNPSDALVHNIKFDQGTFLNIILPAIIFEAGYSLKHGGVMRNLGAVLSYAIIGTLISGVIIGVACYLIIPELNDAQGGLFICLAFGSLLSATDPVSVIALLGSRYDLTREPPLLYNLIFGESVLNDAVAIVLYEVFVKYVSQSVTGGNVALAFLNFLKIFVLSAIIGYIIGLVAALLFKHINLHELPHLEVSMAMLFGAIAYYICATLDLSGIMGVFMAARIIGHHASYNFSAYARESAPFVFKTIAAIAEAAVFFLLGAALWAYEHEWNAVLCVTTIIACLISRGFVVFPISFVSNCFRKTEKITGQTQAFMWYSGLRGAIAFGLAVIFHGQAAEKGVSDTIAKHLLSTTLMVILFTVLIMGSGAPLLLSKLGLDEQPEEGFEIRRSVMRYSTSSEIDEFTLKGLAKLLFRFEKRFIEPWVRREEEEYPTALSGALPELPGSEGAEEVTYGSMSPQNELDTGSNQRFGSSRFTSRSMRRSTRVTGGNFLDHLEAKEQPGEADMSSYAYYRLF